MEILSASTFVKKASNEVNKLSLYLFFVGFSIGGKLQKQWFYKKIWNGKYQI